MPGTFLKYSWEGICQAACCFLSSVYQYCRRQTPYCRNALVGIQELHSHTKIFSLSFFFTNLLLFFRSKQICPVFLHQKTKNCRKKTIIFVQQKYLVFHNNTYPTCFTHRNVSLIIFTYHNFYSLKP